MSISALVVDDGETSESRSRCSVSALSSVNLAADLRVDDRMTSAGLNLDYCMLILRDIATIIHPQGSTTQGQLSCPLLSRPIAMRW